jgi:hypothetical protein
VRRSALLLVLCATARADDPVAISTTADDATEPAHRVPPLLRFEPGLELSLESFDERIARWQPTPDAELHLRGTWREVPEERWRDHDRVRMWSAGVGGSYDLGWARVAGRASYEHVENELGIGNAFDLALELTKTFRITDDITGFVSLSAGVRRWLGKPLPGETNARQFTLSAGLRWR